MNNWSFITIYNPSMKYNICSNTENEHTNAYSKYMITKKQFFKEKENDNLK